MVSPKDARKEQRTPATGTKQGCGSGDGRPVPTFLKNSLIDLKTGLQDAKVTA